MIVTDDKQHLAISFDGNTHGLIFANIARGPKHGHCLKSKSLRCTHIQSLDWSIPVSPGLYQSVSVSPGLRWFKMVLDGSVWYCMVFDGTR